MPASSSSKLLTPRTLKLYLDGELVDGPVSLHVVISFQSQRTAFRYAPQGTFALEDYGYFNGLMDDLRIYERGLSAEEISQLLAGDVNNSGVWNTGLLKNHPSALYLQLMPVLIRSFCEQKSHP